MKISKRSLSIKSNIEVQWLTVLCEDGYIEYETRNKRIYIDEDQVNKLVEGTHYVACPECGKKMGSIGPKHFSVCCPGKDHACVHASINLESRKRSDLQKEAQSIKLKERFKTAEGMITKKIIQENSIRTNSDPEFLKRKSDTSKEVQNRPDVKENKRDKLKMMWSDSSFRKRRMKEIKQNIDKYRESAANARKYHTKTSKLHETYKVSMIEKGLTGFVTEYQCDYYSIDEADPFAKIAVEIDGCYWHGCQVCGYEGDSRIKKIDKRKESYLKNRGWVIIHIKEHELKANRYCGIEAIRSLQKVRRDLFSEQIKKAFFDGSLRIKSLDTETKEISWNKIDNVMQHRTPHKDILCVSTTLSDIGVTEDHSLFDFNSSLPIKTSNINIGDKIIGKDHKDGVISADVLGVTKINNEEFTYDISVPKNENFFTASGILAHNSYSVSGVSLDIEKSSKYQSMKESFETEYDKILEQAKRSIKIAIGLSQPRYGIGISSALGPLSKPGVQSRRNFVSGFRGGWA